MLLTMLVESTGHEIKWAHYVYGDSILGISKESSVEFMHYLGNHRAGMFKLPRPFESQGLVNPYAHLDEKSRANFFEAAAVTEYDRADSISGWDNF